MNSLPPGPKGKLITGVMREFNRDTLGFIERLQRDYGDVVRSRFLYLYAYFLYNPADIETLLTTDAKSYRKARSLRSPFFYRLVGNGLVTSEGEFWRRQRRLAQPAFHRQRISSYGDIMVQYAKRAIANWKDGEERDISREMTRLTPCSSPRESPRTTAASACLAAASASSSMITTKAFSFGFACRICRRWA